MRNPAAIPFAKLTAYTAARAEARALGLDVEEAAKYARAIVRLPLPVVATTRATVSDILDGLELPAVPEVTAEESAAILESLAA